MGTNVSLSEQQIADASLQKTLTASTKQIAKLKDYAMETPDKREEAIGALEEYIERYRGTRSAATACKAISTILTVSMLEILQGD